MNASAPRSRPWLGLVALLGPVLLVSMDGSILLLAAPQLSEALQPSADQLLWILDIYSFVVAPLLVTTGNIGDRYGRLRLLQVGVVIFGLGSVAAALAPTAELLIAARALMGLGGGALLPTTLAVIGNLFTSPAQLTRAIGLWTATFALGFAIGPVIGGLLMHQFWWGSVFLVNTPVVLAFVLLAPRLLPETPRRDGDPIDLASSALSMLGILGVVLALKKVASGEGLWLAAAGAVIGAASLVMFARRQRRIPSPLVDLTLFRNRRVVVAIAAAAASMFAIGSSAYLGAIYLQSVLGLDVLVAGLLGLPSAAVIAVFSIGAGRVAHRLGNRRSMVVALLSMASGLAVVSTLGVGGLSSYLLGMTLSAAGAGLLFSLASETAVTAVPPVRAGSAAALSETGFELGQAGGIALMGSLAALLFRLWGPGLAPTLPETAALPTLSSADKALAVTAFTDSTTVTLAVVALAVLALALLASRWLPREQDPAHAGQDIVEVDAP